MQVRKIKISDAQSVLDLMYQLDSESKFMMLEEGERTTTLEQQVKSLESFNQSGSKVMFVIQDGHEICGFVAGVGGTYRRNRHSMHCIMGTKQSASGNGYGRLLLEYLENWALGHEFTRMELTVMCHNEKAVHIYLKHGFKIEGTKRNSLIVDGQYVDEFYMSKLLHI